MPDKPDSSAAPTAPSAANPPPRKPRKPRPLPSPLAVITAALGTFFVILTLLAIQVRNGRDPALGPGPVVPQTVPTKTTGGKAAQAQQATATKIVTQTSPTHP